MESGYLEYRCFQRIWVGRGGREVGEEMGGKEVVGGGERSAGEGGGIWRELE